MNTILMIVPETGPSAPCAMRIKALREAFEATGVSVEIRRPNSSALRRIRDAYAARKILVTMPPFQNFWMVALPGVKATLDWRDGWSVAIQTGYGGTVRPRLVLAIVARLVELISIVFAHRIIVCTPGLYRYHTGKLPRWLRRKFRLVPNGHQIDVDERLFRLREASTPGAMTLICAGKFGEYGVAKVQRALSVAKQRYPRQKIILRVIGSGEQGRPEIDRHAESLGITVQWEGRRPYADLLTDIANADLAVSILRDETYDIGTKIFDYVALGVPILNVFSDRQFLDYFKGCFDTDYDPSQAYQKAINFQRAKISAIAVADLPSPYGLAPRADFAAAKLSNALTPQNTREQSERVARRL